LAAKVAEDQKKLDLARTASALEQASIKKTQQNWQINLPILQFKLRPYWAVSCIERTRTSFAEEIGCLKQLLANENF